MHAVWKCQYRPNNIWQAQCTCRGTEGETKKRTGTLHSEWTHVDEGLDLAQDEGPFQLIFRLVCGSVVIDLLGKLLWNGEYSEIPFKATMLVPKSGTVYLRLLHTSTVHRSCFLLMFIDWQTYLDFLAKVYYLLFSGAKQWMWLFH